MNELHIPDNLDEVAECLNGLHTLLTAREWDRAAIVYAFTGKAGPRNSNPPPPPKVNIRQFALMGFTGLTTPKAVNRYRRAWEWAVEHEEAMEVAPGDTVIMPSIEFPAWSDLMTEYLAGEPDEVSEEATPTEQFEKTISHVAKRLRASLQLAGEIPDDQRRDLLERVEEIGALYLRLREVLRDDSSDELSEVG